MMHLHISNNGKGQRQEELTKKKLLSLEENTYKKKLAVGHLDCIALVACLFV
jgi:hypothetical protein